MTFFYGLLYFVIRDYLSQQDPVLDGCDALAYIDLCEARFCAGLERFETLTVPVLPNIQALLIGVSFVFFVLEHELNAYPGNQSSGGM
jgi:hypothetical protein